MVSLEMGMGMDIGSGMESKSPQENLPKYLERANEIKANVPQNQLAQVVSELEQYLKLRRLSESSYIDLPDDLKEEIGTQNPMDEFIDRVVSFDLWDTLSEEYGHSPDSADPKWTTDEIQNLIKELKK